MHPLSQLRVNVLQLGCHTFADRLPAYREIALLVARPTDVGETQKVKGLRLPFPTLGPVLGGISPKLYSTPVYPDAIQPDRLRYGGYGPGDIGDRYVGGLLRAAVYQFHHSGG